ncbi:hypothetical protein NP590_01190 [Methylomonas sp. SURF-2]|uniref:DUF2207 domain-containing protein n=1 Tax=Methylomonas subterranea TaxID=2952225 RepID=A0ABT1TB57_9GAMM|nr:hypothetical protein [Methylomonas sp. SURF-2]MCQ8102703.1 hypothetical protein [Methylomonas sp. SURF-2]
MMETLSLWLSEYPLLAGMAFGLFVLLLLGLVFGTLMRRAGMSLKPLVWFFVLMLLVAGPQAVMHILDVLAFQKQRAAVPSAEPGATGDRQLAPIPWQQVFGPDADPDLIVDPRQPLQVILGEAEQAALSFSKRATSALAARFSSPAQAARARTLYAGFFQFAQATGSDALGWTAQRYAGAGEWNHVVVAGAELYAWTAADRDSVIEQRERALGPMGAAGLTPLSLSGTQTARPKRAHEARLVTDNLDWRFMLPFAIVNLAAAVLWFFWGAAWAARTSPKTTAPPAPATALIGKLLSAYPSESAVKTVLNPDGSITLDWNYADAAWFDLMRAHRMKRTQRLLLQPDPAGHTVRVREYWSSFDASAGVNGLRLSWYAATGIQFFRLEQQREFGVQLGAGGRPNGALSHAYRFDLQAMKQPAIDAVTAAGWRWQPVLLTGPGWLRWLTG